MEIYPAIVNISAFNAPAVTIGEITASGFGRGTGMPGLPGDCAPPSRFARYENKSWSHIDVKAAAWIARTNRQRPESCYATGRRTYSGRPRPHSARALTPA